ncbi:hypothetical protein BU24DRAFT_421705 [Aaosphaeria arxii CBS 175.79]|uniref:Uncharacterized protein n=1 Tax=Aaosphaeria arxii CBS 175.79 TaxID=1450172 RepID=A0A6A5XR83_9PLEO|nr:uncharacterized protein BU24DRAFT_421705 [Aaosphaeria arxii CBS 175.79]KAF2015406.1 hypothetical protein BU24DRAFT_421705 [Aaosphaeria arxii CBS 175.79]
MANDDRKDSAQMASSKNPTKPLPTRTVSTRTQEPHRTPSQMNRTTSTTTPRPTTTAPKPTRPDLQRRRTTAKTRYMDMLLSLDDVPKTHNILASASVWILLAGYIVLPATFNKFQRDTDIDAKANSAFSKAALSTVRNVPLLYIAAFACGIGVVGCLWLWWKHRTNYVWVVNRIFLPALMNSIAGLISTLVNVYSAQAGQYSVTAKATLVVTAACSTVTAALFLLYNTVMLSLVKRKHKRETDAVEKENVRRDGVVGGVVVGGAVGGAAAAA